MTFDVAMETGRARRCLAALTPDRSFTPLESVLMTLAGREAEASDPSRLIPGREEKRHTLRLSCLMKCGVRICSATDTYGQWCSDVTRGDTKDFPSLRKGTNIYQLMFEDGHLRKEVLVIS